MSTGIDFYMTAGDTKIITLPVLLLNGDPKNLTGATGKFTLVAHRNSPEEDIIVQKDVEVIDETNGIIKITLDSIDTEGCSGFYPFDVIITSGTQTKTVKSGWISIYPACQDRR